MHSTSTRPFSTTLPNCDRPLYSVVQRKACYHDKDRPRLQRVKVAALEHLGLSSSSEVRSLLKELNIHLDLRMTAAWCAIAWELMPHLLKLLRRRRLKRGNKVIWLNAPVHVESWGALKVEWIADGMAQLELWYKPVPIDELELAA